MRLRIVLLLCALCGALSAADAVSQKTAKLSAFPGAEGFGKYATGGRGGEIRHVTTLADSGPGSLREAVSKPNAVVVFDVAGIIRLKSALVFSSNLTVAAQTAPGDGVVLYGDRVSFSGKSNIICRYLRVRLGSSGPSGKDTAGVASGHNMIFDHMSVSWGRDENFSVNGKDAGEITIQNSIIAQGLQNHSCGGLIQTSTTNGVTLYRNLYIDNKTRNPKVKGLNQFVNNVVYNWGNGTAYDMGGNSKADSLTDIENNCFIEGPILNNWLNDGKGNIRNEKVKPAKPFSGGNDKVNTYFRGNFFYGDKDGKLNGTEILPDGNWKTLCSGTPIFLKERPSVFPVIGGCTSAEQAYQWIVKYGGASLPARDEVDTFLMDELTSLGKRGSIIQNEQDAKQFPLAGPGKFKDGKLPADTDHDGIPDDWEKANKLNPADPSDAAKIASDGYANIENYMFSLEKPSATAK